MSIIITTWMKWTSSLKDTKSSFKASHKGNFRSKSLHWWILPYVYINSMEILPENKKKKHFPVQFIRLALSWNGNPKIYYTETKNNTPHEKQYKTS